MYLTFTQSLQLLWLRWGKSIDALPCQMAEWSLSQKAACRKHQLPYSAIVGLEPTLVRYTYSDMRCWQSCILFQVLIPQYQMWFTLLGLTLSFYFLVYCLLLLFQLNCQHQCHLVCCHHSHQGQPFHKVVALSHICWNINSHVISSLMFLTMKSCDECRISWVWQLRVPKQRGT